MAEKNNENQRFSSSKAKPLKIKVSEAKGRPMLHWVGKKPLDFIKSFPAQLIEFFDSTGKVKQIENPTFDDLKDNWQNLLFHGDNKEVLGYLLANGFRGKIDLVYIDPPFNTGVDYIRKVQLRGIKSGMIEGEDYSVTEQIMYLNNFADDTYLQFMYERLQLLKELLSNKGSIYVRIDYHFSHYIKIIMDEIFGKSFFRNEIIVNRRKFQMLGGKSFSNRVESLLLYTKTDDIIFNKIRRKVNNPDWLPLLHLPGDRKSPERCINGKKVLPPKGRHYGISQESLDIAYKEGRVRFNSKNGQAEILVDTSEINTDWTDIEGYTFKYGYPTENSEELLERIITIGSEEDSIVFDCFMGSGTTQAVAQKLNRKWIGCDINKGAIQTTAKRLQKIILEQSKDYKLNGNQSNINGEKAKPLCFVFSHYKVNDYDLQLLRTEAIELAVQHIGIQRTKTDTFFDGNLGQNLVKIIDFNHPLTLLDLQLIQDELKKRPDENRNITIVCLGKELTVDPFIEDYNKKHPVNKLEVIELRTDKKYGKFLIHKSVQAKVSIKRKEEKAQIEINDFISPSIIERLNDEEKLIKVKIPDFRSMIDVVLVDTEYNGKVFNITYSDVPEKKKDLVEGKYELDVPKKKTTIAVKIIDMLGEEVLITEEI